MRRFNRTASVVYWSEFLATDPVVTGLIPGRYQIFCDVVGLKRGPLSHVSIPEELLEWKSSGSGSRDQWRALVNTVLNFRVP
jgi:hypothetical protein